MSAYVVGTNIIDGIVTAAIQLKVHAGLFTNNNCVTVTPENATTFGQMLLMENVRSVIHRYRCANTEEAAAYDRMVMDYIFSKSHDLHFEGITAKRIQCLDYQSCETDDWHTTLAHEFLYRILLKLTERLPGYEAAAWGA